MKPLPSTHPTFLLHTGISAASPLLILLAAGILYAINISEPRSKNDEQSTHQVKRSDHWP